MTCEAERLIDELLQNPSRFKQRGAAYQLLQEYFGGFPRATLRPLLQSDDPMVQHAAIFVASELGIAAEELLECVVPLIQRGDRYVKYNALEVVMVCSTEERGELFAHVLRAMEDEDEVIRGLAWRLAVRASKFQMRAAHSVFKSVGGDADHHTMGTKGLVDVQGSRTAPIPLLLESELALVRKYGALPVLRDSSSSPELIEKLKGLGDTDLEKIADG